MDETESAENLHRRALNKTADILARRDHSEKELREKLSRFFPPDLIETVVSEARERRWLAPPEELARSAARSTRNATHTICWSAEAWACRR